MELDEGDAFFRTGEVFREFLCNESLPSTRRPLEDNLALVFKEGLDLF